MGTGLSKRKNLPKMTQTQGAAVVVIRVGMVVWMFVSAFIRER